MAQTGYTPIYLYYSGTATHIPLAADLGNGELAINAADGNLFYKNTSNAVVTVPVLQSGTAQNGWLSSTDWNTFNNKQPAGAYLTSVMADSPLTGAGTSASHLSIPAATSSVNGYLTSTDWSTFNGKQAALVSGTNIKTVSGTTLLGSGDLGTIGTGYGGTGLTSFTANGVLYASSTSALTTSSGFTFDGSSLVIDKLPGAISYLLKGGGYGTLAALGVVNVNVDNTSYVGSISNNDFLIKSNNTTVATAKTTGDFSIATGNLVIGTSGKGIDFSATPDATATSELLADYEEGTWTPTVSGQTTAGSYTLSITGANYTKVGRFVNVSASFDITVNSAGTGNLLVGGLPYSSLASSRISGSMLFTNLNLDAACIQIVPAQSTGSATTVIHLKQLRTGTNPLNLPVTAIAAGANIELCLSYTTA